MYPTEKTEVREFSRLKNDIEYFFYYTELLKRHRSEEARKRVEAIVKNIPTVTARIHEIEKIDEEDLEKNPEFYDEEKQKERKITTSFEEIEEVKAEEKKQRKIRSVGFFSFLFRERKKIKEYSKRNYLISCRFFGIFIKLSPDFFKIVLELQKEITYGIIEPIKYIVENGWKTFNKQQYNVVYTFYTFLKDFKILSDFRNGRSIEDIIEYLDKITPTFLKIFKDSGLKNILVESIQSALLINSEYSHLTPRIIDFIYKLFMERESKKITFFNMIIAVFCVYFKRYVVKNDLFQHYIIVDIPDDIYVCSHEVSIQIKTRIEEINQEIDETEKELYLLRPLDVKLSLSRVSNDKYIKVATNILKLSGGHDKVKSQESKLLNYLFSDLLRCLQMLLTGFLVAYEEILTDRVKVVKNDKVNAIRIFDRDVFDKNINDIREYLREMSKFRELNPYVIINSNMYTDYKKSKPLDMEKEERGCLYVSEGANLFYFIAVKLSSFLYGHFYIMKNGIEDPFVLQRQNEESISSQDKDPRLIPFYFNEIKLQKLSEKFQVIDILDEIFFFTVNSSHILLADGFKSKVEKKDVLLSKSEHLLKERSRFL